MSDNVHGLLQDSGTKALHYLQHMDHVGEKHARWSRAHGGSGCHGCCHRVQGAAACGPRYLWIQAADVGFQQQKYLAMGAFFLLPRGEAVAVARCWPPLLYGSFWPTALI